MSELVLSTPVHLQDQGTSPGLFEYYVKRKHRLTAEQRIPFETRESFLKELRSNAEFNRVWSTIRNEDSKKTLYFWSSTNSNGIFYGHFLLNEYKKYLQRTEFKALSDDDKAALEIEYNNWQRKKYTSWTKLKTGFCDKVIAPLLQRAHLLISGFQKKCLKIEDLPKDVLGKIMASLSTMDIFRMTLVSKTWRDLIKDNSDELRRAEYCRICYLEDYSNSDILAMDSYCPAARSKYNAVSRGLINWYCANSTNLEALTLFHRTNTFVLSILLQCCPNLKRLEVAASNEHVLFRNRQSCVAPNHVSLSNLQELSVHDAREPYNDTLIACIVRSASQLRVLQYPLFSDDLYHPNSLYSSKHILANLIALELKEYTTEIFKEMNQIDQFQLKYLKLGQFVFMGQSNSKRAELDELHRYIFAILPRLKCLEALIISGLHHPRISSEALNLMTKLEINLQFAVFWGTSWPYFFEDEANSEVSEKPEYDIRTLVNFNNMLLSKNPNKDLSQLVFVVLDTGRLRNLKAENLGFNFKTVFEMKDIVFGHEYGLKDVRIRWHFKLGI